MLFFSRSGSTAMPISHFKLDLKACVQNKGVVRRVFGSILISYIYLFIRNFMTTYYIFIYNCSHILMIIHILLVIYIYIYIYIHGSRDWM